MASGSAGTELRYQLDTLFRFGVVGDLSDGQLVQRFLTARDGADQVAFAAMVERHGPMVLGVCRGVLGNSHDAEDAFQATFLVLARKAGSVRKADSLASWLHGVAHRVALQAKARAGRRRVYERRAAATKAAHTERHGGPVEGWPELHEEIARLPERCREPVVLYYMEGLPTEEVAMRIGCPHGTVLSRLSRAREQLRRRLERRGVGLSAALLAMGVTPRATAALPMGLLATTVQAAIGFAAGRSGEADLASGTVTSLAQGVLHAMSMSKLKILGATALACGFAWGSMQTFGQSGGLGGRQEQHGAVPATDERQAALTRSVDKLESELNESARRITEMRKAVQDIRAGLKAQPTGPQPAVAWEAATRLADMLKRHPAQPGQTPGYGSQIYMLDLVEGGITLIADEPEPGLICSGMPRWSHDGRRIVFEAATGREWPRASLWAIEAGEGRPTLTCLGEGNVPTFSPDDQQIAFLLHASNESGPGGGLFMMRADGSGRHRVGNFGAPFWSPDGRQLLITSYSLPTRCALLDLETSDEVAVKVPGREIFSWSSWAGPGMLVATLAPLKKIEGDLIALLDVSRPGEARIVEVLWKRGKDLDVIPRWPVFRPGTNQCFFEGEEPTKRTLYSVRRGESLRAKPMGLAAQKPLRGTGLGSLSFSPDGRYLLFDANRLDQKSL